MDIIKPEKYVPKDDYAEMLLKYLFWKQNISDAIDYSDYEGVIVVGDLNEPATTLCDKKFDLVIDGGALEHLHNFPTAIYSVMDICNLGVM